MRTRVVAGMVMASLAPVARPVDGAARSHYTPIPDRTAQVEQWFMTKLVELYGVEDEDALPINFDLLEVMETPKDKRPDFLKEKLAGCPKGTYVVRLGGWCAGWGPDAWED